MVDYLRLAECFYAFLLPGHWLRADTLEVLGENAYQELPKKVQAVCLPLPRADEEVIRRAYFEHINNLTLTRNISVCSGRTRTWRRWSSIFGGCL